MANRQSGFSLVAVTALGVVTTMWLIAIAASVLPMYNRAASGRYLTVIRSSAEAGLDWAVSQLNQSLSGGQIGSSLDDGQTHTVPVAALGNNGATVNIQVLRQSPPSTSSIYHPPSLSNSTDWRVITATAVYAGMQKRIRVILQPQYGENGSTPGGGGSGPPSTIYFNGPVFGAQSVAMNGNAYTDGYNSASGAYGGSNINRLAGTTGTNATPWPASGMPMSFSGNNYIYGSLNIFNDSGHSNVNVVSGSGNVTVHDQIIANGQVPNYFHGTGPIGPLMGDNVLGSGRGMTPPLTYQPIIQQQSQPQQYLPPPVGIPTDKQVVPPTITQTGSGGNAHYYIQQPASNEVVNLGSLSQSGNVVYHIPPGDYELNSLSTSGNGSIILEPGSSGPGIVRFFIQGNSSGSNAVQISGNGVVNSSTKPGNFQIWYGGSKSIQLSGNGNLYATVYSPGANIAISGNGALYGAVIGYNVTNSGNGGAHFDTDLMTNSATYFPPFTPPSNNIGPGPMNALRAVTWQEY